MGFVNTLCMFGALSFFATGFGFLIMNVKFINKSKPFDAYLHTYKEKKLKNGNTVYYPVFRFTEGLRTRIVTYKYSYKTKVFAEDEEVQVLYNPIEEQVMIKKDKTDRNITAFLILMGAILSLMAYFL